MSWCVEISTRPGEFDKGRVPLTSLSLGAPLSLLAVGSALGLGSLVGGHAPLTSVGLEGALSKRGSALGLGSLVCRIPLTILGR